MKELSKVLLLAGVEHGHGSALVIVVEGPPQGVLVLGLFQDDTAFLLLLWGQLHLIIFKDTLAELRLDLGLRGEAANLGPSLNGGRFNLEVDVVGVVVAVSGEEGIGIFVHLVVVSLFAEDGLRAIERETLGHLG